MKRYGNLWEEIVSWPNLLLAARKAQRGKRGRHAVQAFNFDQEEQLLRLARELENGTYRPGPFRAHWIARPKPRLTSAAPYRDRVVHHAVINVLEPILDRRFRPHSFACRKDKGTHAAADRLQELMRRNACALQCDIRKYFPTIDHEVLKKTFRRLVKDPRVLWLLDLIVDHSNPQEPVDPFPDEDPVAGPRRRGLPIGNLTSQWFANWLLDDLDHFVTSRLGIGAYVRYCDDFVLLPNDRLKLKDAARAIQGFLLESLRLRLHGERLCVRPVKAGIRFVGYRIWPTHRLLPKENVRRFRRRLRWMQRAFAARLLDPADLKRRLASWLGHASHADTRCLVRRLSREWVFVRGGAKRVPCASRRLVEQQPTELPRREPQQERAREPEQQHRLPGRPALPSAAAPESAPASCARNRPAHGQGERGGGSPGPAPAPPPLPEGPGGGQISVRSGRVR